MPAGICGRSAASLWLVSIPSAADTPTATFANGVQIPRIGLGVFQVPPEDTQRVVADALEVGYRHIDTAAGYQNEKGVGAALAASGLSRDEVFVTTKLVNPEHGYDSALAAFDRSMDELGLDILDLYLIHWPVPAKDLYVATWQAFEKLYAGGRIRSIGVSNFQIPHLERLLAETEVPPAINQVELHPWLQQAELRAFHAEHGIVTESYSPLAQAGDFLADPVLQGIADKHGATVAQVILRWHLQIGAVAIPKSVSRARMEANLAAQQLRLDGEDLAAIADLDSGTRIGAHPDEEHSWDY